MKYNTIFYYSDIDNAYVTSVPRLPGCMSDVKLSRKQLETHIELLMSGSKMRWMMVNQFPKRMKKS